MKTQEEIDRQVEGLTKMKTWLPEFSKFGTPNHEIIDIQLFILKGGKLSDVEDGEDYEDVQSEIYRGAEEADMWLNDERDEDLFDEQ